MVYPPGMGIVLSDRRYLAYIPEDTAVKDNPLAVRAFIGPYIKRGMEPIQQPVGHDPVVMIAAGLGGVGKVTAPPVPGAVVSKTEEGTEDTKTGLTGAGISI